MIPRRALDRLFEEYVTLRHPDAPDDTLLA